MGSQVAIAQVQAHLAYFISHIEPASAVADPSHLIPAMNLHTEGPVIAELRLLGAVV